MLNLARLPKLYQGARWHICGFNLLNRVAAQYFDTADQTLAKHCIAIRRRQENDEWKQTFKAVDTAKVLSRLELEFDIAPPETTRLDLDNYKDYSAIYKN